MKRRALKNKKKENGKGIGQGGKWTHRYKKNKKKENGKGKGQFGKWKEGY